MLKTLFSTWVFIEIFIQYVSSYHVPRHLQFNIVHVTNYKINTMWYIMGSSTNSFVRWYIMITFICVHYGSCLNISFSSPYTSLAISTLVAKSHVTEAPSRVRVRGITPWTACSTVRVPTVILRGSGVPFRILRTEEEMDVWRLTVPALTSQSTFSRVDSSRVADTIKCWQTLCRFYV